MLLAGVAGLNPCEVLVIGSGTEAISAANAAAGTGARVVLMDNDVSALQLARGLCKDRVELITIHPRVLTPTSLRPPTPLSSAIPRVRSEFPKNLSASLKENVFVINLRESHPSVSVPRTVAMAMSNILINFLDEMAIKNGFKGMVATTPGVQGGMVTYEGKLVDKLVGELPWACHASTSA